MKLERAVGSLYTYVSRYVCKYVPDGKPWYVTDAVGKLLYKF